MGKFLSFALMRGEENSVCENAVSFCVCTAVSQSLVCFWRDHIEFSNAPQSVPRWSLWDLFYITVFFLTEIKFILDLRQVDSEQRRAYLTKKFNSHWFHGRFVIQKKIESGVSNQQQKCGKWIYRLLFLHQRAMMPKARKSDKE